MSVTLVKRGDISGAAASAFTVSGLQSWREEKKDGITISTREIEDVDLFDASPVTYPAYTEHRCQFTFRRNAIASAGDQQLAGRDPKCDRAWKEKRRR